MNRIFLAAIAAIAMSACASGPKPEEAPQEARIPSEEEAGRILAFGRQLRESKGCEAAAPALRVAAAMGEGLEIAQAELGACLLQLQGTSPSEGALFRSETMFWLERAAYAGNAAAQRALALELAKDDGQAETALKWALVYEANGQTKLYGFAPIPSSLISGLKTDLPPESVARAQEAAAKFSAIKMTAYVAPPRGRPHLRRSVHPESGARRRPG